MRRLGRGSHGAAALVRSKVSGALYVLKASALLPEAVNEARLLLLLADCPHVVRLHDVFVVEGEGGEGGTAYLQLDYCDNGDMGGLLSSSSTSSKGSVAPVAPAVVNDALALALLQQVAAGLTEMHARGVVHRDLSPANILLSSSPSSSPSSDLLTVRLADLGVATRLTASLPRAREAAGSPPFMAPEVRRALVGEPVTYDARADVWSLGAVAYALLTGQGRPNLLHVPPRQAVAEVAARRKWPPGVGSMKGGGGGGVAGRLARLVAWCLEPEPGARPTAAEVAAVLRGAGEGEEEGSPRARL